MRAVRQLPGRQREALVLRFYLDLPEREIARLMGLRPSSVRSATAPRPQGARPRPGGAVMTGLENKLRAALRDTAGEIPADPPPLRLARARSAAARPPRPAGHGAGPAQRMAALDRPGPPRWPPRPLVLARGRRALWPWSAPPGRPGAPPSQGSTTCPARPPSAVLRRPDGARGNYPDPCCVGNSTAAEVRATATGAVLAKVVPPKPYVHFAGVTAAADHRTFVLVAEEKSHPPDLQPGEGPHPYYQPSRFYLLRFDPGTGRGVDCGPCRPRSSRPTRRCTTWPCRRTAPRWPPTSAWITSDLI